LVGGFGSFLQGVTLICPSQKNIIGTLVPPSMNLLAIHWVASFQKQTKKKLPTSPTQASH
jgi:hypothetical protein